VGVRPGSGQRRAQNQALSSLEDVRIGPVMPLLSLLAERGLDSSTVLAEVGVDLQLFSDPENRIPMGKLGELLETCGKRTRCPHFGLLLGHRVRPESLGALNSLMRNCATVGEALRLAATHLGVNDRGAISLVLDVGNSRAALGYALFGGRIPAALQILDGAIAMQYRLLSDLCGPSWRPLLIQLSRSRPRNVGPFRKILGPNLEFNSVLSAIVFESRWLDHPIVGADPASLAAVSTVIESTEARQANSFATQVRRAIYALLFTDSATAPQVAHLFNLPERTLRRRLAEEGATVRGLVSEARRELSHHLLRATDLSMSEIAQALHYADTAVFSRAFHAWSGKSPSQWRARHVPRRHGQ
jgi:AraC-like DNA-binding protein